MTKKWIIPIAAVSSCLGFASIASMRVPAARPRLALAVHPVNRINQAAAFTLAMHAFSRPAARELSPKRWVDRTFASARANPNLSNLVMNVYPTATGESLPRYAPGADPIARVKAARDENATQLGSLYISGSGLTLELF